MRKRATHIGMASVLIGLCGVAVMLGIERIICTGLDPRGSCPPVSNLVFGAFTGAMIGGAVCYRLFGRSGRKGWLLGLAGALISTAIGAVIGAGLLMGYREALSGVVFVYVILVMKPILGLLWLGCMVLIHLVLRKYFSQKPQQNTEL